MDPDQVAMIARETVDKALGEADKASIQYATVTGINLTEGNVPYITVSPDGPGNGTIVAVSLIGSFYYLGMRVAIEWTPPAGCVIMGTLVTQTVPYARASRQCSGDGDG